MAGTNDRPAVIDVCGTAYDADCWRANLMGFAEKAPGYLHFFGSVFAHHAGLSDAAYAEALATGPLAAVEALLAAGGLDTSAEAHVASLKAQGVRYQVLHGSGARLPTGETVNDRVAEMAASQPAYLEAWVGLDLGDLKGALAEMERCVETLGMRGVNMVHFSPGVDPQDPGCHEIYGRAAELGVPVWVHTGMNLATNRPLASTTWRDIDLIAVRHPNLVVLAGHGGWPWVLEGMAVLQRHPNVYLEFSAHRPRIMGKPGSGWEPLFFYGRTVLRHKVLFGSAGFVHKGTVADLADEVLELGLDDPTVQAWLEGNAARLLKLPAA